MKSTEVKARRPEEPREPAQVVDDDHLAKPAAEGKPSNAMRRADEANGEGQ